VTVNKMFSVPENLRIFQALSDKVEVEIKGVARDTDEFLMLNLIYLASRCITKYPDTFDERCPFNIENMGGVLLTEASGFNVSERDNFELLFAVFYRFLLEYQICTPGEVPDGIRAALYEVVISEMSLSSRAMSQLKYAEHQMVVHVVKGYLHHPKMIDLKQLPEFLRQADADTKKFEEDFSTRNEKVQLLKDALEKHEDSYNFVGLSDGFKRLRKQKWWEKFRGLTFLLFLAVVMLLPFVFKFYAVLRPESKIAIDAEFYFMLLGFELLLMYYFRVCLQGFKAVKAQLLQIDLRMTLCQFIQSYAKYAKEIKGKDGDLLVRFEQVVFSGIVSSDEAIPSTFDGVEQIAKLITSLKKTN
jgi:hypothetical protein